MTANSGLRRLCLLTLVQQLSSSHYWVLNYEQVIICHRIKLSYLRTSRMANKKSWLATAPKKIKPTVPSSTQSLLKEKADKLIDDVIKPQYVQPITARVRMLYRHPLRQNLHAWSLLLITNLILRTCDIPNNGLKYFRIFRWMSVLK